MKSSNKSIKLQLRTMALSLVTISFPIMSSISYYMLLGNHSFGQWFLFIVLLLGCMIHQVLVLNEAMHSYDFKYPSKEL